MKELNAWDSLAAYVAQAGSQAVAAKELKISPAYMSDLINGRRDISLRMLAKLGLKRVVVKDRESA